MTGKRAFLLSRASTFEMEDIHELYDEQLQLNVVLDSGQREPLVSMDNFLQTESKTFAAPGDDDPDCEDGRCY